MQLFEAEDHHKQRNTGAEDQRIDVYVRKAGREQNLAAERQQRRGDKSDDGGL